ncbi:beta-ketoacyl synthase [Schlegelella sp. S2-27]|uniref:Beta-ketoacyl synthase n=1 Tax=Caldimonas mangrovi TaxID=2944811 RepID=A0ABT0YKB8_9BURK|nr:beta-ketoacyl synthase N-terminal-like domain-containing protein [Caldimonas mangrovi]MCM5679176.1 beta-ketoacyl synthase [Caldimonas mangrovi]
MKPVYVRGRALSCSLGLDLRACARAVRSVPPSPARVEVAPGMSWPFHAIPDEGGDWLERARRIVLRTVADCSAAVDPSGALFLASSSIDIGAREQSGDYSPNFHAFAEQVADWIDWRGPVFTVSTACTSGINALLGAARFVQAGQTPTALVLGVELRNRLTLAGFGAMQLLAPRQALPFGLQREGLMLGESVAAVSLGTEPSRWRVAGGANVVDGSDTAAAVPAAIAAMCRQALETAGLQPSQIGLIKLQAAGSPGNDAIEAAALLRFFETMPPLVSLKAHLGHTLGAAGVAETALLMACIEGRDWPLIGYPLDPSLGVGLAEHAPEAARHILAYILGFGGGHAAVVLEDCTAQEAV